MEYKRYSTLYNIANQYRIWERHHSLGAAGVLIPSSLATSSKMHQYQFPMRTQISSFSFFLPRLVRMYITQSSKLQCTCTLRKDHCPVPSNTWPVYMQAARFRSLGLMAVCKYRTLLAEHASWIGGGGNGQWGNRTLDRRQEGSYNNKSRATIPNMDRP